MKKNSLFISVSAAIVLTASLLFSSEMAAQGDDIVVVVNRTRLQGVSREFIRRIFTGGMKRWSDGSRLKVLLNRDDKVYQHFCEKYLMSTTDYVDGMWIREKIRNAESLPRRVSSSVIKMMVSNSNIFVGFIKRSEADVSVGIIE